MDPADARRQDQRRTGKAEDGAAMSVGELAHELNSLLDGSLRSVGLALTQLSDPPLDGAPIAARLRTAQTAMRQMADVLERVMETHRGSSALLTHRRELGEEVAYIMSLVSPMADAQEISMTAKVDRSVAGLPVGPLGAVLLNGLRNAAQACARCKGPRRVELKVAGEPGDLLAIRITDNGPGCPTPEASDQVGGHGLGLDLCHRIVGELGGTLELAPNPAGRGTVLTALVPTRSLRGP